LITGSIDMSIGGAHNITEHYSEIGITVGTYIFKDFDHAYNVTEGEIGQYLNNNLIEKVGIRFLDTWKYGERHITTKGIRVEKPVFRLLSDMYLYNLFAGQRNWPAMRLFG
jgi:TRAP-type C4-dicarboxylate transport system substrate-binding protein